MLLKSLVLRQVRYRIKVFQGMFGNCLPNPTQRTVEGSIDFEGGAGAADLVGASLTLKLEDGRRIGVTIASALSFSSLSSLTSARSPSSSAKMLCDRYVT